jgi:PhnB protein
MAKPVPDGYSVVTPYLVVNDAKAQIEFLTRAFDATLRMKLDMPDGSVGHAEMTVFGGLVMMGQAGPQHPPMPAMIHLYVADVDAVHARAVAAGGTVHTPVRDQFYGDRSGSVRDANGNVWSIATHTEDLTPDEIKARMAGWGRRNRHGDPRRTNPRRRRGDRPLHGDPGQRRDAPDVLARLGRGAGVRDRAGGGRRV